VERAVREVVAVGQASGVALADTVVADTMRTFDALSPDAKPSLLLDVERGGPTELDALSGTVARLGRTFGVDTPVHDTAVAALSGL
jgi:2-dehydropantoate 2-reductase